MTDHDPERLKVTSRAVLELLEDRLGGDPQGIAAVLGAVVGSFALASNDPLLALQMVETYAGEIVTDLSPALIRSRRALSVATDAKLVLRVIKREGIPAEHALAIAGTVAYGLLREAASSAEQRRRMTDDLIRVLVNGPPKRQ